jgi:hypothetical protein
MTKLIVNVESGEIVERELNKAEKDQQKIDEAKLQEIKAEQDAKITAKQAIADRLGLTADELKLLLG